MVSLDDFKRFVNDAEARRADGTTDPQSQYAKWASANPGDLGRWRTFRDAILAGQQPSPPTMTTVHGRELVDGGLIYVHALAPTPPPPPAHTVDFTLPGTLSSPVVWSPNVTGGGIARVEFSIDGVVRWTETVSPYQYAGDPDGRLDPAQLTAGSHTFKATAIGTDGSSASHEQTATVPTGAPPPPPPPPPTGLGRIGFASNFRFFDQAYMTAEVNKMHNAGIAKPWIREDCDYAKMGNWAGYDALVSAAAANGVSFLAIAMKGAPSAAAFGDFCAAIAARYNVVNGTFWQGKTVKVPMFGIECVNEPWLNGVGGALLADMCADAGAKVHSVAPGMPFGVNVHHVGTGGGLLKDFLDRDKAIGKKATQYLAFLADHPYSGATSPTTQDPYSTGPDGQPWRVDEIVLARNLAVSYGVTTPWWVTEYGTSTAGGLTAGNVPAVGESLQASYTGKALTRFLVEWTWIERVFLYTMRDYAAAGSGDGYGFFGIHHSDGTPKPAAKAVADWIAAHPSAV